MQPVELTTMERRELRDTELERQLMAVDRGIFSDFEIVGRDTRKRVRDSKAAPYRYIFKVRAGRSGTGTLIGPRTVLTAAHVMYGGNGILPLPAHTTVTAALNGSFAGLGSSIATNLIPNPDYDPLTDVGTAKDFGIIHLQKRLGNSIGYWGQGPISGVDPRGTSISGTLPKPTGKLYVNLCGYPADKGGNELWRAYGKTLSLKDGLLFYENDTKPGHSGSPVWVKRSKWTGGRVLVAIHVDRAILGRSNKGVHMSTTVQSFIRDNML